MQGIGGEGGGGNGINGVPSTQGKGQDGTANTGGGSGGGTNYQHSGVAQASGGSGVVILKVPTANYSTTTTGSPTVTISGDFTILKYTGSGTYTT